MVSIRISRGDLCHSNYENLEIVFSEIKLHGIFSNYLIPRKKSERNGLHLMRCIRAACSIVIYLSFHLDTSCCKAYIQQSKKHYLENGNKYDLWHSINRCEKDRGLRLNGRLVWLVFRQIIPPPLPLHYWTELPGLRQSKGQKNYNAIIFPTKSDSRFGPRV